MKLYKNGEQIATYKVGDDWIEFEDEIVETPLGSKLKSFTFTNEYKKELEKKQKLDKIGELKQRLNELSQDFVQAELGAEFDNITERKQEFKQLHNELREILGKEPRNYN